MGFVSGDLATIVQPVLAVSGGRSNRRFQHQDERLAAVIPHAEALVFSERSHLSSPHKDEPARFAGLLADFWARVPAPGRGSGTTG